ncbi:unnamed protein product [Cuscuta epithymum]|uniref:Retrovirus-related Pol polyprotein from transposon TNT 1-94-like beta-barrel domain-containing protein n=1 Tax=Cuscuta epithymum TaxID=186058 RepID=A0AAV0CNQ0_9ASTE|nr:unnamed protein product [Cuscuta epithymum]
MSPGIPVIISGTAPGPHAAPTAENVNKITSNREDGNGISTPLPGFTPEQWQTLLSIFGNSPSPNDHMAGKFNTKAWIIDTGATNHVCGNLSLLCHIKSIEPCSVGLPDGQNVLATQEGRVILTDDLYLNNVLFVP